ncbi:MAG: hypothetical protein ABUK20_03255 [Anaerolineales bacterium]
MSKKRKRQTRTGSSSNKSTGSSSSVESRKLPDNFNPDYSYVAQDLRRIGTLAGIFISILVILALFMR